VADSPAAATDPASLVKATVSADGRVTETFADGSTRSSMRPAAAGIPLSLANGRPVMLLKTTPRADGSTSPPTVSGPAPLTVRFNLCQSSDPDQDLENPERGDTINWQFHFGDSGNPAFDEDGTFKPDFDHFCRVEHTYQRGQYTATVSVTDKHLEDQGKDVAALARVTQQVAVDAFRPAEDAGSCPFVEQAASLWLATGDFATPLCTCPLNGQVLPFLFAYVDGCSGAGFGGAIWSGGGTCGCLP
jgi:hypothetical protein